MNYHAATRSLNLFRSYPRRLHLSVGLSNTRHPSVLMFGIVSSLRVRVSLQIVSTAS